MEFETEVHISYHHLNNYPPRSYPIKIRIASNLVPILTTEERFDAGFPVANKTTYLNYFDPEKQPKSFKWREL